MGQVGADRSGQTVRFEVFDAACRIGVFHNVERLFVRIDKGRPPHSFACEIPVAYASEEDDARRKTEERLGLCAERVAVVRLMIIDKPTVFLCGKDIGHRHLSDGQVPDTRCIVSGKPRIGTFDITVIDPSGVSRRVLRCDAGGA